MTITLERLTREKARERQSEILEELAMTVDEMRDAADSYTLDARQRGLAREYERLDYLADS